MPDLTPSAINVKIHFHISDFWHLCGTLTPSDFSTGFRTRFLWPALLFLFFGFPVLKVFQISGFFGSSFGLFSESKFGFGTSSGLFGLFWDLNPPHESEGCDFGSFRSWKSCCWKFSRQGKGQNNYYKSIQCWHFLGWTGSIFWRHVSKILTSVGSNPIIGYIWVRSNTMGLIIYFIEGRTP